MARPKVIIADEDASYIVPLQFKFVTDFFNKIDLEIITDRAYFDEYFSRPQNAEILIISDDLYDSSLQRHNIQNIFVMMEQYDEGSTGELNVNQIFKYTSIKEIFNEIIGKSTGALNIAVVEKKETQIILVTSAVGGVGKTTVAMGVAACLEQNYKRVLYINKDYRVTTRNDNINFRYNKDKWYKGYSFTWSNIKRNILHDMGRTATTGKFKDGSFKIKLTSSDKVSKYSVYFKDKKFELGKLTFNFSKETYSIPEKLVKFFNVTKTTDNTMNFLKNVDGLYDFYTESDKSFGGSIKALKNVTGIGKNSKAFSIFDKYGTKTVKTIEDVVGLIGG